MTAEGPLCAVCGEDAWSDVHTQGHVPLGARSCTQTRLDIYRDALAASQQNVEWWKGHHARLMDEAHNQIAAVRSSTLSEVKAMVEGMARYDADYGDIVPDSTGDFVSRSDILAGLAKTEGK